MTKRKRKELPIFRGDLKRTMVLTLWIVPILMGVIGIGYTYFEYQRHLEEGFWPWPAWLGIFVLGFVGPTLSWLVLRWALNIVEAYMDSQAQLTKRAEELTHLNKLSITAGRSLELEERIATILEGTMDALDAAAGMVFIGQDDRTGLRLEAYRGISVDMARQEARLSPGHCLCGQAVETRKVLFAEDVGDDPRCTSNLCICEGFRSVACAPLEVKGELVGLLQVASPNVSHFTNDQTDFLAATANQVSISIENARLYSQVRGFNAELEERIHQRTGELEAARSALSEKARQLQRLLSESYRIQEDTQARIAKDMHDGVTQIIIGALYETQAALQSLSDHPDRAAENLVRAQQLLSEVDSEIRQTIYNLHPPVLDMMGLVVALKRFAQTYSDTFHVDCQVEVKGESRRLSKEYDVAIYRIIQSALQNVAAHARAGQVQIGLNFGNPSLTVTIEDDGVGFNPQAVEETPEERLGLLGMRERAEALGGSFELNSQPGSGTRIKIHIPSCQYLEA